MSARAIGSSTISFGLVSLPVKLYSTSQSGNRISFNLVHEGCGTKLKQQYICPADDEIVPREDMAKGYEFAKGQFVIFTDEELKAVEAPKGDAIDIVEFVPAAQVDRIYFDKAYFLGPDKGGGRAYRLLSAALRDTERVAIAKYATRGKQYVVMIRPHEEGLIMEQLRYAEELKDFSEVPLDEGKVSDSELKLARQLIEQASTDEFKPENYTDEVHEQMLAMIQRKVEGEEITAAPAAEVGGTQIIDLMAALKASLAKSEPAEEEGKRKPATRAAKKKTTKAAPKKKAAPRKKAASG
jgi:DNA end-binding protein Ku